MPVLSPRRSAASPSYRSTFGSSNLDRPYYGSSNSYMPRITSYSERFTTRSYIDGDGRRVYSRQGSVTEDGITTRFKEEMREGSARRDSITRDSIRENSILDTPRRDSSLTRGDSRPRISAINVAESVAEMRNKYSPSNYVPACLRNTANDNHSTRSKSINDIGKPPAANNDVVVTLKNNSTAKLKVNGSGGGSGGLGSFSYSSGNNGLGVTNFSNNTNNGHHPVDNVGATDQDDNGNRSVAEIRKKFDASVPYRGSKTENNLAIEGTGVKISENRFKKQDSLDGTANKLKPAAAPIGKKKTDTISAINKKNDLATKKEPKKPEQQQQSNANGNGGGNHGDRQQQQSKRKKLTKKASDSSSPVDLEENDSKLNVLLDPQPRFDGCKSLQNGHDDDRCQKEMQRCSNVAQVERENDATEQTDNTDEFSRNFNHTSNFASYIPSKDDAAAAAAVSATATTDNNKMDDSNNEDKHDNKKEAKEKENAGDPCLNNEKQRREPEGNAAENRNCIIGGENNHHRYYQNNNNNVSKDISSAAAVSPRLNRALSQNAGTSNNYQRSVNSSERDDDKTSSPVKNLGLNGLKNIGNTCFMNSVIQCLSNTKLLLEYVKNDVYISDINTSISSMKGALIKAFSQVIKELWSEDSSDRVVNTLSLKSQIQRFAPRFMGYSQQDAQEFLRYLLEGLHEDVNRVTAKPAPILTEIDEKLSDNEKSAESWQRYLRMDNSKVVDIFVGQLKSTLKCTHCGHCSVTFDPFWDLSLPIPQRQGQLRLQQCLEYFTREETLDGDEKPTCSRCKERRKCTKSFTIQKFPKILVIHLKRFSPTERFRGKLSVTIDFPLEGLDMRNYAAETSPAECRYNLYAISNHSGTTYSGHYTAYCRHPYSHAWHEYNDSRVSTISPKMLVSGEAYVLFYELDSQKSHL